MASSGQPDYADERPRASQDSLSSVSTTSIVFDRLNEESEKPAAMKKKHNKYYTDVSDEDYLREETDDTTTDDLETGPFLGRKENAIPAPRQPMARGLRLVLYIGGGLFVIGWLIALGIFVASGSYRHMGDSDHDPDATSRLSGKSVTLDQVQSGFWRPKSHSISWIDGPDGADGFLLEQGASGKDYLIVENVRARGQADSQIYSSTTLMKESTFKHGGRTMTPSWVGPSPDLSKVLLAVDQEKNWRHSFTAAYFILDVKSQTVEPLVPREPDARVQLATWSPNSDAVAFTRDDNNLYVVKVSHYEVDGQPRMPAKVTKITEDGGAECFNGVPDWVYEEEVISGRSATWWSADGKHIAFLRTNETGVPEYPIQYFISRPSDTEPAEGEEAYPEERYIKYPKAGAHNPVVEVRFYDVEADSLRSIDSVDEKSFPDDDRIINSVTWAGEGKVLVKQTNRVSDVLQVLLVDVSGGSSSIVRTFDANAVDGGWYEISHKLTFVPADDSAGRPEDGYVDSVVHEGYDHIAYFTPLDNPEPKMLTSGEWEVDDAPAAIALRNNLVYFTAAKRSSIQRHVYSVSLIDPKEPIALADADADAFYSVSFSTGADYALLSYQGPKVPTQRVVNTPSNPHRDLFRYVIEENTELADRARTHTLPVLNYGQIVVTDDEGSPVSLNYLERRPPHFDQNKQYPVLFQQYSGPGSQAVQKKFAVDFQSYVASALGYIVVTVDPRGTGFRGRAHRIPVRDRLGVLEAADHAAAARHFASLPYVDSSRIAIWGWSYGGFTTLKTLEQDAGETFSYGMAVAPVTDWRFYDSIYTERYMRTPQDNNDGYEQSSISNATALGQNVRFLLMHGVADDNVHFQNSLTLLDELDVAGVENYDVHVFPDSDHGIYFHNGNRIVYDSKPTTP
jgi:dipeptidyl aminopeptidase